MYFNFCFDPSALMKKSSKKSMEISYQSHNLLLKDRRVDALGNLNSLPDELICTILDYLTPRDIARLACVSRLAFSLFFLLHFSNFPIFSVLNIFSSAFFLLGLNLFSVMFIFCNEEPLWMSLCLKKINGPLQYKGSWKKTTLHLY